MLKGLLELRDEILAQCASHRFHSQRRGGSNLLRKIDCLIP
jgi:hypothetical protein